MKRLLLILKYGRPGRHMPPGLKFIVPVRVPPVSLREMIPARPIPKSHLPQVEGLAHLLRAMESCRACGALPKKNVDSVSKRKTYGILSSRWPMWFAITAAHLVLVFGIVTSALWYKQSTKNETAAISKANLVLASHDQNGPSRLVAENRQPKVLGKTIVAPRADYSGSLFGKEGKAAGEKIFYTFIFKKPSFANDRKISAPNAGRQLRLFAWEKVKNLPSRLGLDEIKQGFGEVIKSAPLQIKRAALHAAQKTAGQIYTLALQMQKPRWSESPFFGGSEFQAPEIVETIYIPKISLKELPKKTLKISGRVLGETIAPVDTNTLSQLVDERLKQYLAEGKFKGEKGEKGERGETGAQGASGSSSLQGGGWSLGYVNTNNPGGTGNGTIGSFTYFSSDKTQINVLNVSSQLNVSGPANFTGTVSFATTTLGGIAYAWPGGDGSANQVLVTNGLGQLSWANISVAGATWSTSTNGSIYYSSGNVGIGTSNPVSVLHVVGNSNEVARFTRDNSTNVNQYFSITENINGTTLLANSATTNQKPLIINVANSGGGVSAGTMYTDFQIGGTSVMTLKGSNVGIGTTSPGALLDVNGASIFRGNMIFSPDNTYDIGANGATRPRHLYLSGSVTLGNALYLNTGTKLWGGSSNGDLQVSNNTGASISLSIVSGNVGIGTTSPNTLLTIGGSLQTTAVYGLNFGGDTSANFYRSAAGVVKTDGQLSGISFFSGAGTTYIGNSGLELGSNINTTWSSTLAFNGAADVNLSRGGAGRLYIGNGTFQDFSGTLIAGNVGIGTTSPTYQLDIQNSSSTNDIRINNTQGSNKWFDMYSNSTLMGSIYRTGNHLGIQSYTGNGHLLLNPTANNVGIGTSSPIAKLDVYGNLNVATSSTSVLFANTGTSRVGIGTSTPADTLHIVTTSAFGGFTLQSTNDVGMNIKSQAGNGAELKFTTQGVHLFARANSGNLFIGNSGGTVEMIGINSSVSSPNSVVIGRQGAAQSIGNGTLLVYDATAATGVTTLNIQEGAGQGATSTLSVLANNGTTTRLTVLGTSGNVGIGTGTPLASLHVQGSGSSNMFTISSSTGAHVLTVFPSGNIGIGAVGTGNGLAPNSKLYVTYADGSANSVTNGLTLNNVAGQPGNFVGMRLGLYSGNDTSQKQFIGAVQATNGSGGTGDIVFLTITNGGSAYQQVAAADEKMRITNYGNVGIGTTGPADQFEVANAGNVTAMLRAGGTANQAIFRMLQGSGYTTGWQFITQNATSRLDLESLTGGVGTNRLTILNTGNVGIGTASPLSKLNVYGSNSANIALISGPSVGVRIGSANGTYGQIEGVDYTGAGSYQPLQVGGSTLDFTISGNKKVSIDTNGNVGIGTTTPGFKLDVVGAAGVASSIHTLASNTGGVLIGYGGYDIQGRTASDQNGNLALNPYGGNVGIGTTSPVAALHVNKAAQNDQLILQSSAGAHVYSSLDSGSGSTMAMHLFKRAGTELWESGMTTTDNYQIARISGSGNVVIPTGNVGIGTTSPSSKLDVNGQLTLANDSGWTTGGIRFRSSAGIVDSAIIQGNNGYMYFRAPAQDGGYGYQFLANDGTTRLVTIQNGGNVGIGTTSPLAKLDVYGNLNVATGSTPALFVNTATGNVGIGTSTPTEVLSVTGKIRASSTIKGAYFADLAETGGYIQPTATDLKLVARNGHILFDTTNGNVGIGTTTPTALLVVATSTSLSPFVVTSAGNVGIGTASPGAKLDVVGGSIQVGALQAYQYVDSNVRTYRDANNGLQLDTGGSNRVTITSVGNVGIGTTSPLAPLHVLAASGNIARFQRGTVYGEIGVDAANGNGTTFSTLGSSFLRGSNNGGVSIGLYTSTSLSNAPANGMIVSGNVGIGTTSPIAKLDVWGDLNVATSSTSTFYVNTATGKTSINALLLPTLAGGGMQCLRVDNSGNVLTTGIDCGASGGSLAGGVKGYVATWASSTGLTVGTLIDNGTVSGVNATSSTVSFLAQGTGTLNPFQVNSSTGSSLLTVTPSGNVGVGTTAPNYLQENYLSANGWGMVVTRASGASVGLYVDTTGGYLQTTGPKTLGLGANGGSAITILNGNNKIGFNNSSPTYTVDIKGSGTIDPFNVASSSGTSLMVITNQGNVGIGTTDPAKILDIQAPTADTQIKSTTSTNYVISRWINGNNQLQIGLDRSTGGIFGTGSLPYAAAINVWQNYPLQFGTNSVMRMTIEGGGNVGIGTTSPSALLHVGGGSVRGTFIVEGSTADIPYIQLKDGKAGGKTWTMYSGLNNAGDFALYDNSAAATPFTVKQSTGNVGIGTTSPATLLHMEGASAQLRIATNNDSSPRMSFYSGSGNVSDRNWMIADGLTTRGALEFKVGSASGVAPATDVMSILSNGNVGIGTTGPSHKLHVAGTGSTDSYYGLARFSPSAAGGESEIGFFDDVAGTDTNDAWVIGQGGWSNTGDFIIGNENNGAGGNVRLLIEKSGNVGIGTTSPATTLDVNGTTTMRGALLFGTDNTWDIGASGANRPRNLYLSNALSVSSITAAATVGFGGGRGGAGAGIANGADASVYATAGKSLELWADATAGRGIEILTGTGNVGVGTTTPTLGPLTMASGAYVTAGGTWTNASDRNLKENFASVTPASILEKIVNLPIAKWNYKREDASITHLGPTAQDFYASFGLGGSDTSISTIDPSGVALVGIKALDEKINSLQQTVSNLQNTGSDVDPQAPIVFKTQVYLSQDSVGQAKILAGSKRVKVTFTKPYEYQPIVTATPLDFVSGAYRIASTTAEGFTIELKYVQDEDVTFNFHAFASPEAKLTVSDGSSENIVLVVPQVAGASVGAGETVKEDVNDSPSQSNEVNPPENPAPLIDEPQGGLETVIPETSPPTVEPAVEEPIPAVEDPAPQPEPAPAEPPLTTESNN